MASERATLLVVDDDLSSRLLLHHFLDQNDFDVTQATDGTEALALLKRERFDLVLLDVEMPGLDGLQVLRRVREMFPAAVLPVMMATVQDHGSAIVEALNAGANDYVTKPFDLPVVLARVRTIHALKQAHEQLRNANRRFKQELDAAARVQAALLPRTAPRVKGVQTAWHYRPCTELAGDLLGLVKLDEGRICLYVLDVVDHGVKAALLAVMINRVLSRLLAEGGTGLCPAEVAMHLNREFPWDHRTEQFFTLMLGVVDPEAGDFRFVSAGQPGPLHLARGQEPQLLRVPGSPIGWGDGSYELHRLLLGNGDRLYLYSDGLTEARRRRQLDEGVTRTGRSSDQFGDKRFSDMLHEARDLPLQEGITRLVRAVEDWCHPHTPHDDISVVAVELV
jgi:sigma-B regulation protein RsbU (phosphoserine phosphatase)